MEEVNWKVEGMTCANCALTISNYLEKEGLKNIHVNPITGKVSFETEGDASQKEKITKYIHGLGYKVIQKPETDLLHRRKMNRHLTRTLFCLPFTLLLMMHMIPGIRIDLLMNPWVQLFLCLPVYIAGLKFLGATAFRSILNGMPNMNVLIIIGATAAFIYSFIGTLFHLGMNYQFFETTAVIITLVFFGYYLEDASVASTQKALHDLAKSQKVLANMIAFDEHHQEIIFQVENSILKTGDLILIKTGEQVPADCKIIWGDGSINESIITGESLPVFRKKKDRLIGGSTIVDGTIKAQVIAAGNETVLANILRMVEKAQAERPEIQKMADKISAIFVPAVLIIAIGVLIVNFILLHQLTPSLMRSIAVLVIACPCAMGLATPAAIAVGLGRAAKNGVLFRTAVSLENFKDIRQAVFDKTGTLTTGKFHITSFGYGSYSPENFKLIAFSLEKYSNHPIAICLTENWKTKNEIRWQKINEIKGVGIRAIDHEGNEFSAGSDKLLKTGTDVEKHSVYILKNNELIGWIDVQDEIRPEAAQVIQFLKKKKIKTILISGDRTDKCRQVAETLHIDEVFGEQSPEEKLEKVASLSAAAPTLMVGDGINDAPALAKATIGISMSDASHLAMQTSEVVLVSNGLKHLPFALGIGKHTYRTIKQNLFWAFVYNIIAIPVAGVGLLTPAFSAISMGISDVILALNSVRLFIKKVE